jgi:hypothetical protein
MSGEGRIRLRGAESIDERRRARETIGVLSRLDEKQRAGRENERKQAEDARLSQ